MSRRAAWLASAAYLALFVLSIVLNVQQKPELLMTDVSRLIYKKVTKVVKADGVEGLQEALREAEARGLPVSIAGAGHSQGGHTFYEDALVLDMKAFNRILSLDPEHKRITVQSGATWGEIQDYINPYGLSVQVMQSSNIFTVGGSLSSNVHGRDVRTGPIIETVDGFRLLLADGEIVHASRESHPELFQLAIGGFGLFGVILDADIRLTDNVLYEMDSKLLDYRAFDAYFEQAVLAKPEAELSIARLSIAPGSGFMREMYVTRYLRSTAEGPEDVYALQNERHVARNKFLFGLSRKFGWGKSFSWWVQKKVLAGPAANTFITRNNAMRPEVEFLEHRAPQDTDLLQEYFVPRERFASFVDEMRDIMEEENVNLLNASVRYLRPNTEAYLSYARQDSYAIVILMNQRLSRKGEEQMTRVTRKLVDAALHHGGTYYLTYQLYPAPEQLRAAYPEAGSFFDRKRAYDPDGRFQNLFNERYGADEAS